MRAKYSLRANTQATYSRGMSALPAATLAVLIDPILRLSDYRVLQHLLPVTGTRKFSDVLTLVFLQLGALFYLIVLLPRILRTVALFFSVFVIVFTESDIEEVKI